MKAKLWLALAALAFLGLAAGGWYAAAQAPSDDLPEAFPRVPPIEPADVGKKFHVLNGFKMDLIAAEPLARGPIEREGAFTEPDPRAEYPDPIGSWDDVSRESAEPVER